MEKDTINELQASGTITSKEFVNYNLFHTRKFRFRYFWLLFLLFFLLILLDFPFDFTDSILTTVVVGLIVALFVSWLVRLLIQRRATNEYKSDNLIQQEINFTVNELGITQEIKDRSKGFFDWESIIKGYEFEKTFILYVSKNKAILLPKRFVKSTEDLEQLKKMVRQKTKIQLMN